MSSPGKWILVGCMFTIVLIIAVLCVSILMKLTEERKYCEPFTTETYSARFEKIPESSLFPYSGTPSLIEQNSTVAECAATCEAQNCLGFYFVTNQSTNMDRDSCHIYQANNVAATLGSNVNTSSYFTVPNTLTVGAELPEIRSDVYVSKVRGSFQLFRSAFGKAKSGL